ncbi:MAG: trypsin-like peptidase domain-containing protein [Armatimonadota bacterium]
MRRFAALILLALLMALPACERGRGTVVSAPGETSEEMTAAGEVLGAVGASVPLIRVQASTTSGNDERQTVGVVVDASGRILLDAEALSLTGGSGDGAEFAHSRSIEVIFHPGLDSEHRHPATVVRQDHDSGMALVAMDGDPPPPAPLGDDVSDGTRAFLISDPLNAGRLVVEAGTVRDYVSTDAGRFVRHTAGRDADAVGPIFDSEGRLIGLQVKESPADRMAIPAVEIAQWLRSPMPDAGDATESDRTLSRLLPRIEMQYRVNEDDAGYVLPRPDDIDVLVREAEGIITVEVDLGALHVGDAIEALRSNYSDPVGAYALKSVDAAERLVWVARLPAYAANASYLEYIIRIGVLQSTRWTRIVAGMEPGYPYEHYPGGDQDALREQLAEVIRQAQIPHETSGDGHRLRPDAQIPVYVNEFHGMAYVYAFSGGMPGEGDAEQDQIARTLLRRNWEMPLGRLALDRFLDLEWEAQVPIEHLTTGHLAALVQVAQEEIARLNEIHGEVPFNE